jgi:hypothetical protein
MVLTPVTVRQLPDGVEVSGNKAAWSGRTLDVSLRESAEEQIFRPGTVAEVTCPEHIYLGTVVSRNGDALSIDVEHAIDRAALARLQSNWSDKV